MDHYKRGAELYFEDKLDLSLKEFDLALDEKETGKVYLAKAKVNMAKLDYNEAYDDSMSAIRLDNSLTAAYKIKAESAFYIEEYLTSKNTFLALLETATNAEKEEIQKWLNKLKEYLPEVSCNEEEENTESDSEEPIVEEIKREVSLPAIQIYHNYFQKPESITINILGIDIKNIPRENFKTDIDVKKFLFKASLEGKADYIWEFDFFEEIIPSKTKISKIEIICEKSKPLTWPSLEKSTKIIRPPVADTSATTYPSPYAAKKDWDTLAKEELKEELKEKEEADGLNLFFQQLYSNADPDTRRAMQKSFSTSGGTVLSTNWKEVKEKDYEKEVKPPDGLEYKKEL